MSLSSLSLTTRILLLVLLALAPALAIQGYNEVALRASRNAAVRADALTSARGVAADFSQIAEQMRQALDLISGDPSVRARDPSSCAAYLKRSAARLPHVLLLALTDPDGTLVCDSAGSAPGAYSTGARAYHHRALEAGGFAIGGYAVGRLTNRRSLHFARVVGRNAQAAGAPGGTPEAAPGATSKGSSWPPSTSTGSPNTWSRRCTRRRQPSL
ncbi:PDC sensor domain-containing protein [Methylobacterium sp. P31]